MRGLHDTAYTDEEVAFRYPLLSDLSILMYLSYLDENRDEVKTDTEIDVSQYAVGGNLPYSCNDHYDVGLSYGYVVQDSDRHSDN